MVGIATASPRLSGGHPALDAPMINSGDDNPSLVSCAIFSAVAVKCIECAGVDVSFAAAQIMGIMDVGGEVVVASAVLAATFLVPKAVSFLQVRSRRAALAALAAKKQALVQTRNAAIVAELGLDRPLTARERAITARTATSLLQGMRCGELTSEEVVTAFCARAAEVQPTINCGTEFCFIEGTVYCTVPVP